MKRIRLFLFRAFHHHNWFYYEPGGIGDYTKRVCGHPLCQRQETYYGSRGYNHPKNSDQWMTNEEWSRFLAERQAAIDRVR